MQGNPLSAFFSGLGSLGANIGSFLQPTLQNLGLIRSKASQNIVSPIPKPTRAPPKWGESGDPRITYSFLTGTPTPTQRPNPSPMGSDLGQILLPTDKGVIRPPRNIENAIFDVFGPTNQATEAASVLLHPLSMGLLRPTRGENQGFITDQRADKPNQDGSIDRGLFRINSNTFADFMRRKPEVLMANGIYSYDDMLDPLLNTRMAKIIQEEQGWGAWVAAPQELLQ